MTADANHDITVQFFKDHNFFGLNSEHVIFFQQDSLPVISFEGKILNAGKDSLLVSAEGNGGIYSALRKHNIVEMLQTNQIEYIQIVGIDNLLLQILDPVFLGFTHANGHQISVKTVSKIDPDEKVGVYVKANDKVAVVEYSELGAERAHSTNEDGQYLYNDGCINITLYKRIFLENLLSNLGQLYLEYHVARKKVPNFDLSSQTMVSPSVENAFKMELFYFDVFKFCPIAEFGRLKIVREDEFAVVKNAPGAASDSPETARALVTAFNKR